MQMNALYRLRFSRYFVSIFVIRSYYNLTQIGLKTKTDTRKCLSYLYSFRRMIRGQIITFREVDNYRLITPAPYSTNRPMIKKKVDYGKPQSVIGISANFNRAFVSEFSMT